MSEKLNNIPYIINYEFIRNEMNNDLQYRLKSRNDYTFLGRPLYERINLQLIITQECPYSCPFCLEKKNPMQGSNDFEKQLISLKKVILGHPNARLTITGGEPSLYVGQVKSVMDIYEKYSNGVFASINTTGFNSKIADIGHINLSVNKFVKPNLLLFPNATYQTVLNDDEMTINNIKQIILANPFDSFSFRFLTDGLNKKDYPVTIWNEIQNDNEIQIKTFRIGDFFVYCTFNYNGKKCRITLGDMYQQSINNYFDGYSNIIIHPDGEIMTNWK